MLTSDTTWGSQAGGFSPNLSIGRRHGNTMRSLFAGLLYASLGVGLFAQTPTIRTVSGVQNAASEAQQGMPNAGIAQGSMFTVFGTNLGPAAIQKPTAFPIGTTLSDTSVNVTANGNTVQAPMIFTIASQVAAVMPSTTPVGTVQVSVTYKGVTSALYNVEVVANSFGTFSVNYQGDGPGVITDVNGQVFNPTAAAMPGDPVIIWGTGLGALPYNDADQPQAINLTGIPLDLFVGGQKVATGYQGPSGCCAGINQVVFTVPAGVTGCSVPVTLVINNVASPTTTMPVTTDPNRVCSDANGLSSTVWSEIFSKASVNLGSISLNRTSETFPILGTTSADSGSASFINLQPLTFFGTTSFQVAAIGSCIVSTYSGGSTPTIPVFTGLDAGPMINNTGPNGPQPMLPIASQKGAYSTKNTSTFLSPGGYAINNGAGGADVGAFSLNLTVPEQAFTWTNETSITTVSRTGGVTVNWTGGAPGSFAKITGLSAQIGPPEVGALFTCTVPVAQGTFTVGPDVLLQLPVSTTIDGFGSGLLEVGNSSPYTTFAATGLDYGFASTSVSYDSFVTYQ
jgi:uncharacterized protein (TIGR03437 family)